MKNDKKAEQKPALKVLKLNSDKLKVLTLDQSTQIVGGLYFPGCRDGSA